MNDLVHEENQKKRHDFIEENVLHKSHFIAFGKYIKENCDNDCKFHFTDGILCNNGYKEIHDHLAFNIYPAFVFGYMMTILDERDPEKINRALPEFYRSMEEAKQ